MATLSPSFLFFFLLIIFASGKMAVGTGDWRVPPSSAAAPEVVGSEVVVGKDSSVNYDYGAQCMSDLGPCGYQWCDENCCINTCNIDYVGYNPHPICADVPGQDVRSCQCWHDCH